MSTVFFIRFIEQKQHPWLIAFFNWVPTILLAYMDEELCGFANFHYEDSTFTGCSILMVKDLYTVPAFRSRGVAKTLLRYMAQRAEDKTCIMGIGPLTSNTGPLAWYRSLGAEHSYDVANLEIKDLKAFIRNLDR